MTLKNRKPQIKPLIKQIQVTGLYEFKTPERKQNKTKNNKK